MLPVLTLRIPCFSHPILNKLFPLLTDSKDLTLESVQHVGSHGFGTDLRLFVMLTITLDNNNNSVWVLFELLIQQILLSYQLRFTSVDKLYVQLHRPSLKHHKILVIYIRTSRICEIPSRKYLGIYSNLVIALSTRNQEIPCV